MSYTLGGVLVLVIAGVGAGVLNAISSGGTLITYPALLLAGSTALEANATSAVGLLIGYVSGTFAYRHELRQPGNVGIRVPVLTGIGAVVGTTLLLNTDEAAFRRLAPVLVLFATVLLIAQPHVARSVQIDRGAAGRRSVAMRVGDAAFVCCGAYGSYFGAGMGILILGALGSFLPISLHMANAWKNALSLVIATTATGILTFSGLVSWPAALGIAVASAGGAMAGVRLARKLSATSIRWATVAIGLVLSAALMTSS